MLIIRKIENRYQSFTLALVVSALLCNNISAQLRRFTYNQVSVENGLSQNSVFSIHKDHRGFVWLGTGDGLNRYDGSKMTVFNAADDSKHTLLNGLIFEIAEDVERDQLYFATGGGGLSVFNPQKETFKHFNYDTIGNAILSSYVYDLKVADDGLLWIANSYGVSVFDPDTEEFRNYQTYHAEQEEIYEATPTKLHISENGNVWVGTYGYGLIKINTNGGQHQNYQLESTVQDISANIVHCISDSGQDELLLGTSNGLFRFNERDGHLGECILKNYVVTAIEKGINNDYWIGTERNGLIHLLPNGEIEDFISNEFDKHSLPDKFITSLYRDEQNHLWIGTQSRGVINMPLKPNFFEHYYSVPNKNSLNGRSVYAIEKDDSGNVWLGTMIGLSKWNPTTNVFESIDPLKNGKDLMVWYLKYLDDGNLLIGTSSGLIKYNIITTLSKVYKNDIGNQFSLPSNEVFACELDSMGRLWVGTNNGLCRYDEEDDKFIRYKAYEDIGDLSSPMIWDLYCDSIGEFWVSTDEGLNQYDYESDNFTMILHESDDAQSIASNSVSMVNDALDGNVWVSTGQGVDLLSRDLKVIKHYGEEEGLRSHYVYTAHEYKNKLWLSTNNGISSIDLLTDEITNFDFNDGVQGHEFNPASLQLEDGRLILGGINGFNIFHPDSLNASSFEPPIYFTGLQLYGNEISVRDTASWNDVVIIRSIITANSLKLNHQERFFNLEFAALDFDNPDKVEYFYRMLPNTVQWVPLKNQKTLTFIDLSPGSYDLEVRSTNSDGVLCDNAKKINITVNPPIWREVWFIILLLIAMISMGYLLVKYRIRRLRLDKINLAATIEKRTREIEVQRNIAHKQRDEISRQKAQLEEFTHSLETKVKERTYELEKAKVAAEESDHLKSAFLSNMSHEIRTPMNAIIGFSELLLDSSFNPLERVEFAQMIKSNGDELLNLLNDIIDISMIESGQIKTALSIVSVNNIVNQVYANFTTSKYLVEKDRLKLLLDIPEGDVSIYTDSFRLRQILNNLVSNALKFTNEGYVKVGYSVVDGYVRFYVEDTGIGIDEAHQRKIFERFLKVKNDTRNLYRGNGLGLTITKNLVELLDGSIGLSSKEGEGSYFFFQLPLLES